MFARRVLIDSIDDCEGSRRQNVNLPPEVVDELGCEPGDELEIIHVAGQRARARRSGGIPERPRTEAETAER